MIPGTRLGPYEVIAALGKGGMGEVYRARDSRLGRDVAVKVLPEELFEGEERRKRFEREARLLAALNHPGIAAIYSFEEIPSSSSSSSSSSRHLLVMELVEGETLSARLEKGPLPLDQVLRCGAEMGRALDVAHRKGIVHRDLKPGNVMLTKSGVKLLDFGLARSLEPDPIDASLSGLETQDKALTVEGAIVGTLPYMAPEQVQGRAADARTDIFALGATLYEMTTGRRAFSGSNQASLIASILTSEPAPIPSVRAAIPASLDRIVRTCLAKDPDDRWQSAADVARELQWAAEEKGAGAPPPSARARGALRERLAWGIAALAVLLGTLSFLGRSPQVPGELTRFKILPPPGQNLLGFALVSPEARRLLLLLRDDGGKNRLAIRSLDSLDVRILPATEDARGAFWSPDGLEVGFFSDGKLKRISADGGPARVVCDSEGAVWGAWSPSGTILFAKRFGGPLYAVPAAGGTPVPATDLDAAAGEIHQNQACFLPDGRHFVYFWANADVSKKGIRLGTLGSKETRPLFASDSNAVWADGYLIFARDDAVLAWRFDPKSLHLVGEPFPAFENVKWATGDNFMSLSAAGKRVAYVSWALQRHLVWVDRKGREIGVLGGIAGYADVRISPDGRKVAVAIRSKAHGGNGDIWVLDAGRGTPERITTEPTDDFNPAWFPDGQRLAYVSDRFGWYNLFARPTSGGPEKLLVRSDRDKTFPTILPDGRHILVNVVETPRYVRSVLSLDDPKDVVRVGGDSPFSEEHPALSADGKWTAFDSLESGQREVYVQPLAGGPKRQVSVDGGQMPVWSRNGRELFYAARNGTLMSVALRPDGGRLEAGEPQPLFPLQFDLSGELTWHLLPYGVTPDGERFLVIRRAPGVEPDGVVVVSNWTAALKKTQ
ncbi:MAG TPA: protein kinase [Thermoanaerobaculia bacterium]|nr:protein kinase [Thermoanaerobaculia bacterium]